jgi:hypothetical protein
MIVKCIKADNPVPGTTGWHLTEGKAYTVKGSTYSEETGLWYLIEQTDNGEPGSYHSERFIQC